MDAHSLNAILNLASNLLRRTTSGDSPLKPSDFFNEGWMTALTLAVVNDPQHPLDVPPFRVAAGGQWWCEAGLRSQFKPRKRGDKRGETTTWVDAVLGHFEQREKRGIQIRRDATQFSVIEAKLESRLSKKTSNTKEFDQAARTVACMAKELEPFRGKLNQFQCLSFHLLAPADRIARHEHLMKPESIKRKVLARIDDYDDTSVRAEHHKWYDECFLPLVEDPRFQLKPLKWENVIATVKEQSAEPGQILDVFYRQCLDS